MVRCPRCGYENSPTSVYCDNCAYLLADSDGNRIKNTRREASWNMGLGKKIVIVLGIIVIAFLLFSFIYNNTQPSYQDSLNVITDDGSNLQSSSYPYKAVIIYEGSWSWDRIAIDVQKQDYGSGELTVQLVKNGEVVEEKSSTNATGHLVINYNY